MTAAELWAEILCVVAEILYGGAYGWSYNERMTLQVYAVE